MGYTNLYESLKLNRGHVFAPCEPYPSMPVAVYFPGCGGGLFYDRIGLSSIMLLLKAGFAVAVPPTHLCCGYPLIAAGHDIDFDKNLTRNRETLGALLGELTNKGFKPQYIVTSCGSCRSGLEKHNLGEIYPGLTLTDISQLTLDKLPAPSQKDASPETQPLYHASCHAEWAGTHKIKGQKQLVKALEDYSGASVAMCSGCCGESGMGAVASPEIYNPLRERKIANLAAEFEKGSQGPILVGCPSCKIGIGRSLLKMNEKRPVLHIAEWLAGQLDGEDRRQTFRKKANETRGDVRVINLD